MRYPIQSVDIGSFSMLLLYSAFKCNIGLNLITREEKGPLGVGCRRGHLESRARFSERCGGHHFYDGIGSGLCHQNGGLDVYFFDPRELNTVDEAEEPMLENLSSNGQINLSPEIYDEKFEMCFDSLFEDGVCFFASPKPALGRDLLTDPICEKALPFAWQTFREVRLH